MANFINGFFRFILKLVLAVFGLVLMASLLVAAVVVVVLSLLKSLLTGKKPAIFQTFSRFQAYSPKGMWPGTAGREARGGTARRADVVDVEVREIKHEVKHEIKHDK